MGVGFFVVAFGGATGVMRVAPGSGFAAGAGVGVSANSFSSASISLAISLISSSSVLFDFFQSPFRLWILVLILPSLVMILNNSL